MEEKPHKLQHLHGSLCKGDCKESLRSLRHSRGAQLESPTFGCASGSHARLQCLLARNLKAEAIIAYVLTDNAISFWSMS
eukprot:3097296-Amphidinium_carterae.1